MMFSSFPTDVFVLDREGLTHCRLQRGKQSLEAERANRYRFGAAVFENGPISPAVIDAEPLGAVIKRIRNEAGRFERASLLLPDSWFRMNMVDLPADAEKQENLREVVRWAVRRSLPVSPEQMRLAWIPVEKRDHHHRYFVVGATEATLSALETAFRDAGVHLVTVEPLGLNIWNAIAVRETADQNGDRLFVHVGRDEFTTAVFRAGLPLFVRSRLLGSGRSLSQEIQLSASFLKSQAEWQPVVQCYVSGEADSSLHSVIANAFEAPVRPVKFKEWGHCPGAVDCDAHDPELAAAAGVFTS